MSAPSLPPTARLKITEALVLEHRVFAVVFDQIEKALPRATTPGEVQTFADVMVGLLTDHGREESELAYLALDHVLHDCGQLERLHQEHQEIDASLERVRSADTCDEARHLLETALTATRRHMRFEEETVFPVLEQALRPETLAELGAIWAQREVAAPRPV